MGIQGFCKDLLDVADNLARASATVDTEALETETGAANVKTVLTSLHEGVLMVEKQLTSAFGKHGVVKFDPSEATRSIPTITWPVQRSKRREGGGDGRDRDQGGVQTQ